MTHAARALGMSRRHLTRLLHETPSLASTPCLTETPSLDETSNGGKASNGTETPSDSRLLTYAGNGPIFRGMASAPVSVSVELPGDLAEWLEDEALARKRREGRPRPAKSPIVVEALERLREALVRSEEK